MAQRQKKRPIGRPRGPATPAAAAVARRNGRKMVAAAPPEVAEDDADELDIIRRQLARLNAEAELLYQPGSRIGRRERAKESRAIARAMGALVPKARLRRAELVVRGEADQIAAPTGDPPIQDLDAPQTPTNGEKAGTNAANSPDVR